MDSTTNRWVVALVVSLATFMEGLDMTIANVALPHIARSLGTTPAEGTWVVSSYLIAAAIVVPLTASHGDGSIVDMSGTARSQPPHPTPTKPGAPFMATAPSST